jgi:Peptidase family M28
MRNLLTLAALLALVAAPGAGQGRKDGGAAGPARRAAAVDAAQLLADLRALAADEMEGRAAGTPGGERARAYVAGRFKEEGLRPFGASYLRPFEFSRAGMDAKLHGANVVGFLPGTSRPRSYLVLSAHYDHVGNSPQTGCRPAGADSICNGADDNASGVAALLAAARHFRRSPPRHTVVFAAFDAEEAGLAGSRHFVADPPFDLKSVVVNVNLDMVGRGDRGELYAAGARHHPFLKTYVERAAASAPVRLLAGHDDPKLGRGDWTSQSDHAAFHRAGVPFLYFGVEDHADYHRPTDESARVPRDFFAGAAQTVLAVLLLLDAEPPPAR